MVTSTAPTDASPWLPMAASSVVVPPGGTVRVAASAGLKGTSGAYTYRSGPRPPTSTSTVCVVVGRVGVRPVVADGDRQPAGGAGAAPAGERGEHVQPLAGLDVADVAGDHPAAIGHSARGLLRHQERDPVLVQVTQVERDRHAGGQLVAVVDDGDVGRLAGGARGDRRPGHRDREVRPRAAAGRRGGLCADRGPGGAAARGHRHADEQRGGTDDGAQGHESPGASGVRTGRCGGRDAIETRTAPPPAPDGGKPTGGRGMSKMEMVCGEKVAQTVTELSPFRGRP